MSQLPVLIVGAGPTGLMVACELKRHGIPFRIIDKNTESTKGSNATWIQTRTLEIFDIIGILNHFLKPGHKCEAINFYLKGKEIGKISLTEIDSIYPYILMLPQSKTEQILEQHLLHLGTKVERSSELLTIQETDQGILSTIRQPNQVTENIISDWIIACDGANSTVREKCHIAFPGKNLPEQFMVADAKMSSSLPTNEIHVFFDKGTIFPSKRTIFAAFPWGEKEYRLTANLYLDSPRQSFTAQEVKEIVSERTYGNYIVENVSWISPFWIHSKFVNQMNHGAIFFAGDAAHIHSPAGGQGMNTGIQDAFNLAWKLALVIKQKANISLLNSYQKERLPIIEDIVTQTDFYTNMFLFDKDFSSKLKEFNHQLSEHPALSRKIAEQLTQIDIRYKKSPIINYSQKPNTGSPQQGERAPNVKINNSKNLYDYLSNSLHYIMIFAGNNPTKEDLNNIKKLQDFIGDKFSDLIKILVITPKPLESIKNIILDPTSSLSNSYKVNCFCTYIIRPDNYIAYFSKGSDASSIGDFLKNYLLIP